MAGNSRVIIGQLVGSFAAKVSKPGYNVDTATEEQLLFDQSLINLRLFMQGESASVASSTTINFGATLARKPIVIVKPKLTGSLCDGSDYRYFASNVSLTITTSSFTIPAYSNPFAYFVFINEAYT